MGVLENLNATIPYRSSSVYYVMRYSGIVSTAGHVNNITLSFTSGKLSASGTFHVVVFKNFGASMSDWATDGDVYYCTNQHSTYSFNRNNKTAYALNILAEDDCVFSNNSFVLNADAITTYGQDLTNWAGNVYVGFYNPDTSSGTGATFSAQCLVSLRAEYSTSATGHFSSTRIAANGGTLTYYIDNPDSLFTYKYKILKDSTTIVAETIASSSTITQQLTKALLESSFSGNALETQYNLVLNTYYSGALIGSTNNYFTAYITDTECTPSINISVDTTSTATYYKNGMFSDFSSISPSTHPVANYTVITLIVTVTYNWNATKKQVGAQVMNVSYTYSNSLPFTVVSETAHGGTYRVVFTPDIVDEMLYGMWFRDSRESYGNLYRGYTVYSYTPPKFTIPTGQTQVIQSYRCNQNGTQNPEGKYCRIIINYTSDTTTLPITLSTSLSTTLNKGTGITPETSTLSDHVYGNDDLGLDKTYSFVTTLSSNSGYTTSYSNTIGSASYLLHFKTNTNSLGIGSIAGNDETLTIGWNTIVNGDTIINGDLTFSTTAQKNTFKTYLDIPTNIPNFVSDSLDGSTNELRYDGTASYQVLSVRGSTTTKRTIMQSSNNGAAQFGYWNTNNYRGFIEILDSGDIMNRLLYRGVDTYWHAHQIFYGGDQYNGGNALGNLPIYYGSTAPSNPTTGTIWLKPV